MKNIEKLLATRSLSEWCSYLGWQGETIHQVREETEKRLTAGGMSIESDGTIVNLPTNLIIAR